MSVFPFFLRSDVSSTRNLRSDKVSFVRSQIFGWEMSDLAKNGSIRVHGPRKYKNKDLVRSQGKKVESLSDFKKNVEKVN